MAGLKYLAELESLERLGLGFTEISDAGLKPLQGLKNLKTLFVLQTPKITNRGLSNLRDSVPGLRTMPMQKP